MSSCRRVRIAVLHFCWIFCLVLMSDGLHGQTAVQSWADPALDIRDGLIVWLDASRLPVSEGIPASSAASESAEPSSVSKWQNAVKKKSADDSPDDLSAVFTQESPAAQPRLMKIGESWVVRFDGEDDHLRLIEQSRSLRNVTVFLVTAPHSNPGTFRGILAANEPGRRDYESGFTVDQGPGPTMRFEQLNVEGAGFGGAVSLQNSRHRFGTLHTLEMTVDSEAREVRLICDGQDQGKRATTGVELSLDELTIGARYYTNGPGRQEVRGPFHGDVAEVLIYDRVLTNSETLAVRRYLNRKYEKLGELLSATLDEQPADVVSLDRVTDAPEIQMIVPGFRVRRLPLELTNVNNVRFRRDGKLITLGYNGDIHLLTDTDGDGLEDHAELFFKNQGSLRGPLGMLPTPPEYSRGGGVFVPSKGKVSLIVDTDGDDRADEEVTVAAGWAEIPQNVDALGIAMDEDGYLYFGLGTVNYANAYLLDENGKARYDLNSERGTVQRVSPDFSRRETVCTGIRFPVAFAFNRHGDLFCTEQEGATWLPNGNPFDELLHIRMSDVRTSDGEIRKRHYGFPPRHPRHNPDVIDEPSVFDFGPQHQSTCGMTFNESINGGPIFGPPHWEHDALITGESRGKLWRTSLIKSEAGYVAASQLIACLQLLTVDCCVAPNGDLVVACHSGPPDWGTGPSGIGQLYRISMVDEDVARPAAVWAEGPQEIRVAFDRPLNPASFRQLDDRIRIEFGEYVRAADRYENLIPPYAVVQAQLLKPRYRLPVLSTAITNDLRTIVISTAPMESDTHYSIMIPGASPVPASDSEVPQHGDIDVDFSLRGVHARWIPDDGNAETLWEGWLPHADLDVCRGLLSQSAIHLPLWERLDQPGTLLLNTRMQLNNLLRPAVQPGASIDYEWPPETATITFTANRDLVVQASRSENNSQVTTEFNVVCDQSNVERQQAVFTVPADSHEPVMVRVIVKTGKSSVPQLTVSFQTSEDQTPRPLQLHRFVPPWVKFGMSRSSTDFEKPVIAEIEGGSWARGRKVFHSDTAACYKCHSLEGTGPGIGPGLANLLHRDYASVVRDIANPSFAINPDYIGHVIALKDGRVLTGVLQSSGDQLILGDEKGRITPIDPSDIETSAVAATSVMPAGLLQKLTSDEFRDLMTYLLTSPPQMPLESPLTAPPLRTQADVSAALKGATPLPENLKPLTIVLVDGPKDHGPGEHDYPAWRTVWEELLSVADDVTVQTAHEFPDDSQLAAADVLIFFQKGSFDGKRPEKLDAYLARGGGAVYIHWAVNGNDQVQEFSRRIGLASWGGRIAFRHGPLTLDIHNSHHPIVRNFEQLKLYDESYWKLTGSPDDITLLASSREDGMATPQMWVTEQHRGRVFVSIPGHYSWTFDDPLFRILLLRGIAWTAHQPVDRFNSLVPIGARMTK